MYSVTCDNREGMRMTFDTKGFNPFVLARVEGIFKAENNVFTKDNTMTDGAEFRGIVAKKRNIILTLMDNPNNRYNQPNRDVLYALFSEHSKGRLTYEENESRRVIDYYVEKVYRVKPSSPFLMVSLICPDPYFYDEEDTVISLADWQGDFKFDHTFNDGETIEHKNNAFLASIMNDVFAGDLGLTITLEAIGGNVVDPSITRVEDGATIKIGRGVNFPYQMPDGTKTVITTHTNNKNVMYYGLNDAAPVYVNHYLTEDSQYIQLKRGANTLGFDAKNGKQYLVVTIAYRKKYEGA